MSAGPLAILSMVEMNLLFKEINKNYYIYWPCCTHVPYCVLTMAGSSKDLPFVPTAFALSAL